MTTAFVMTAGMNTIISVLTPIERWQAARQLDGSFMSQRWFILTGLAVIVALTLLLILISYNRSAKERKVINRLFLDYADRRGLNQRELQILLDIANRANLKRNESIFTMATAFNLAARKKLEETRTMEGIQAGNNLNAELSVLREKLGFDRQRSTPAAPSTKSRKPNSRQIPAGKQIHIIFYNIHESTEIESTVIKNNDIELAVKLSRPLECREGELCCARYYFGASVWEFDTSVISCHGGILVLNHSDEVRFINRRRFLRVPVNKPAFIARFPFSRTLRPNINSSTWAPPEFVPASVTELAGPGLRIEAPLEVKVGERVVVILKMSEQENQSPVSHQESFVSKTDVIAGVKDTPAKIVEDIGEVRHTKAIQDGFSIAVELTGLSDLNVNELISDTNAASLKNSAKNINRPEPIAV